MFFWDSSAEIRLLGIDGAEFGVELRTDKSVHIPESIYTTQFNSDSLQLVSSMIYAYEHNGIIKDSMPAVNEIIKVKSNKVFKNLLNTSIRFYFI